MAESSVTGSSAIADISWDDGTLLVIMRDGSRLAYSGVPEDEYEDFRDAGSKGGYFNMNIRNRYSFSYG